MLWFYLWSLAADKALPVLLYYHSDLLNNPCDFDLKSHLIIILIPKREAYKHLDVFSGKYSGHLPRLYLNIYWTWAAYLPGSVEGEQILEGFPHLWGFFAGSFYQEATFNIIKLSRLQNVLPLIAPWAASRVSLAELRNQLNSMEDCLLS